MTSLKICTLLFERLFCEDILYCHWKSNLNLGKSCAGQTDFDLLVRIRDCEKFNTVLRDLEFKRIITPPSKQFPGIEDYLGFDSETGRLCHLHVHYKLILGQKYIKNHHLPIENIVLSDLRILDSVYIPSAEMELLLLVIRSCMKLSIKNILQYLLQNRKSFFPKNILNEFRFLLNDYKQYRFRDVLLKSGLPLSESRLLAFIEKLNNETLTIANILLLRFHIFKSLRPFRYQSYVKSYKKAFKLMLHMLPLINKIWPVPRKKLNGRGRSFSLVGADGSGKTTLVKDLIKWLSWKMQVRTFYFGIPKTLGLKVINKIVVNLRSLCQARGGKTFIPFLDSIQNTLVAFKWVCIARKRLRIFNSFRKVAETGGVAITDRYPLADFWNMDVPMDGPRIRKEGGNGGWKWADREEQLYLLFRSPTKVFVLKASIAVLRKRRNDLNPVSHNIKAEAVHSIEESHEICAIDANRPYDEVLINLKRKIWELL